MRIESTANVQYPRPLSLLCDVLSKCFRCKPLKTEVIHSDYCWSVLQYLTHQGAFTLKQVSKGQKEQIDHELNNGELPNALPEMLDLNGINMLKEAQNISSTERLVKEVNDQLQWDAAFIIHCLEKTKGNEENQRCVLNHAVNTRDVALSELLNQHRLINDAHINKITLKAVINGHVEILGFLTDTFEFTIEDVRAGENEALRFAAKYGHVEVLRFLTDKFQLTIEDVKALDNEALRLATENGHVEVLRFLTDKFELTNADARAMNNWALRLAAIYGHVEILGFLTDKFELTKEDAIDCDNEALRLAAIYGHVEVVEFFEQKWGLTLLY